MEHAQVGEYHCPHIVSHRAFDQQLRNRLADDAHEHLFKRSAILDSIGGHINPFGPRVGNLYAGELYVPQFRPSEIASAQVCATQVRASEIAAVESAA